MGKSFLLALSPAGMMSSMNGNRDDSEAHFEEESAVRGSFWRTGLLLTTSAVLGGIAVAIWNRRTLAQIRQQSDSPDPWRDRENWAGVDEENQTD